MVRRDRAWRAAGAVGGWAPGAGCPNPDLAIRLQAASLLNEPRVGPEGINGRVSGTRASCGRKDCPPALSAGHRGSSAEFPQAATSCGAGASKAGSHLIVTTLHTHIAVVVPGEGSLLTPSTLLPVPWQEPQISPRDDSVLFPRCTATCLALLLSHFWRDPHMGLTGLLATEARLWLGEGPALLQRPPPHPLP